MDTQSTAQTIPLRHQEAMTDIAQLIRVKSIEKWGPNSPVELLGLSPKIRDTMEKVQKFAKFNQTILITGESGVGKEFLRRPAACLEIAPGHPLSS
jgi:DNA-binding NtrC family response regulator